MHVWEAIKEISKEVSTAWIRLKRLDTIEALGYD
jgi:hypothetical protein